MSNPYQHQTMPYGQAGEPPLWAPYYGAPFPAAIKRFWQKYTAFSGRASRSEYWWWVLVAGVVGIILRIISSAGEAPSGTSGATMGAGLVIGGILSLIWGLATIVPSLALLARRLHDVNMSAWLILIVLVPFLGALALLVLTVLPSNPAGQRFDQPTGI